jgi:hypothetical protein
MTEVQKYHLVCNVCGTVCGIIHLHPGEQYIPGPLTGCHGREVKVWDPNVSLVPVPEVQLGSECVDSGIEHDSGVTQERG